MDASMQSGLGNTINTLFAIKKKAGGAGSDWAAGLFGLNRL
jgi:hypothetical protein